MSPPTPAAAAPSAAQRRLFVGSFVALVTTAFGFIVRAMLIDEWGREFALTETQKGEIFGVGLWPFAISIVLFSLVVDKIGYGRAMVFAFACHALSVLLTITADSYEQLYWAMFIVALGNGTVEAVINPVVATMFRGDKTKWLNILHAGWPGGLVLGGLLAIALGHIDWRWKIGLILVPALGYALILLGQRFPVHERVEAGVSYREMLREMGALGALVVLSLILLELGRVFGWSPTASWTAAIVLSLAFGLAVRGIGQPIFVVLLLIMIPLATTELGTDSWITSLMTDEMKSLAIDPGWVLIYTAFIMMVLRFFAGGIVHRLSPLGLLATSSLVAAIGLLMLSTSVGAMVFVAATIYGLGKTFFWPTMLGIVSERFPKGGALTLNATGGVGMIGAGLVGAVLLGYFQDTTTSAQLAAREPALAARVIEEKQSVFGRYQAVDKAREAALEPAERERVAAIAKGSQKSALAKVAWVPVGMVVAYLLLALYFRMRGGYRAQELSPTNAASP